MRKVEDDTKPFTEVESYFADAKFYTGNDVIQEVLHATIPSTRKAKLKKKVKHFDPTLTRDISQLWMTLIEKKKKKKIL